MTVAVDPELGPVRLCGWCLEWWPDDAEFYRQPPDICRACVVESPSHQRRMIQRRDASRRLRARRRRQTVLA